MALIDTGGQMPIITDEEFIMLMFPTTMLETECCFLLGNYVELVDKIAISKQSELTVDTLLGVIEGKKNALKLRSVPFVNINFY